MRSHIVVTIQVIMMVAIKPRMQSTTTCCMALPSSHKAAFHHALATPRSRARRAARGTLGFSTLGFSYLRRRRAHHQKPPPSAPPMPASSSAVCAYPEPQEHHQPPPDTAIDPTQAMLNASASSSSSSMSIPTTTTTASSSSEDEKDKRGEKTSSKTRGAATARGVLPRNDALDKTIVKLAVPAVANFAILPLVGTVDTVFVGRLGDSRALAALGAANQVFSSVFFVVSFLPSVVTPLVAAAKASGDENSLRKRVSEAIWVSAIVGLSASILLASFPTKALTLVLPATVDSVTQNYAKEYLSCRALGLGPAMLAFVGFATFRGLLDVVTPLKVSAISQMANVVLDPVFIFLCNLGVKGAALATAVAETIAAILYAKLLAARQVVKWSEKSFWTSPPSIRQLAPLLLGGAGVLARSLAMNTAFISVTRATQRIDESGTLAAAHTIAMQVWQLGGVWLFALSAVASILVPATLNTPLKDGGGPASARRAADRMLGWGLCAGLFLATAQLSALPLLGVFTSNPDVQAAARAPAIIGACLQLMNGCAFIAEGIMQGLAQWTRLARNAALASAGLVLSLHLIGHTLTGVWLSFGVFNSIRLALALHHHLFVGPLARRNLREKITDASSSRGSPPPDAGQHGSASPAF